MLRCTDEDIKSICVSRLHNATCTGRLNAAAAAAAAADRGRDGGGGGDKTASRAQTGGCARGLDKYVPQE